MHASHRALLFLLFFPASAGHAARIVSVQPLPHGQINVCWRAEPNVEGYWISGGEGVEDRMFQSKETGTICHATNVFLPECQIGVVLVRGGKQNPDGQWVFGGQSNTVHFISAPSHGFDAPPLCSPREQYPTIESAENMAPATLRLADITTPADATPRIRVNLQCAMPPPGTSPIHHFEIYENTLKPDGSTATRTTRRDSCPNDLVLEGNWGDRTTVTAAAIYTSDEQSVHTVCTAPQVLTFGSALVGPPQLKATDQVVETKRGYMGRVVDDSISRPGADDILLFYDPSNPYQLQKPDETSAVKSGKFRAEVDLGGHVYAVARRKVQNHIAYSEPVAMFAGGGPQTIALAFIDPVQLTHQIYVSGNAQNAVPVTMTLTRDGQRFLETTLHSCNRGQFAGEINIASVPAGTYTLTATAPEVTQPSTTVIHFGRIAPQPAISLGAGPGPFAVAGDSVELEGRVTPLVSSGYYESAFGKEDSSLTEIGGGIYKLDGTLNDEHISEKVAADGSFLLRLAPLRKGKNRVRLKAIAAVTKQESEPIDLVIASGEAGVDPEDVQRMLAKGWDALDDHPDVAINTFTKVIEMAPNASSGFTGRAAAAISKGEAQSAFDDASHAVQLDPRDYRAWSYRGNFLIQSGKNAEVIETSSRSIELDSTFTHPFDNRATSHYRLDEYPAAIMDATKAIELKENDAYAYRIRSASFEALGESRKALADLNKLVELNPQQAAQQFNSRAWREYKRNEIDRAIVDATKSIELQPSPYAYGTRAWAREAKGDASGALDDFDKALALSADYGGIDLDRGMAEYTRGNYGKAVELWEKALAEDPSETAIVKPLIEKARQQANKR